MHMEFFHYFYNFLEIVLTNMFIVYYIINNIDYVLLYIIIYSIVNVNNQNDKKTRNNLNLIQYKLLWLVGVL